jgi:ADP-heptose:LPS heptosyltransferase
MQPNLPRWVRAVSHLIKGCAINIILVATQAASRMKMKFLPEDVKKIAVFKAQHLRELLCAVPAFRALRHAYPSARITLLGLPWASTFVPRFSAYFDSFIHFPGYPGMPEQDFDLDEWDDFVARLEHENFDFILQMQGSGIIVNEMLQQITRSPLAGFHSAGNYMGSEYFMEYPSDLPEIERNLVLMEYLGVPRQGNHLEFPIRPMEEQNLARLKLPIKPGKYVCVHPGARGTWGQWPSHFFAALADQCGKLGYSIVITGTRDENEVTREVIGHMHSGVIDLTGKTTLGEVGALIRDALMLISNCTGISHLAEATHTPSLVINMDGEAGRWEALNKEMHRTINWLHEKDFNKVKLELEQLLELIGAQNSAAF